MQITESEYQQYLKVLLAGDAVQCKSMVDSFLQHQVGILDLYEQIFRRSLYEIGDLWFKNQISVADEHLATAITESLINQVQAAAEQADHIKKRVFVSCVTADLHQVGARMVANLFELHGWDSYYLGANMPITDLLGAIEKIQPDVICLSLVLIEHIKTLEVTVNEIRLIRPQTPIIVGGGAFSNLDPGSLALSQVPHLHILKSIVQLEELIDSFS